MQRVGAAADHGGQRLDLLADLGQVLPRLDDILRAQVGFLQVQLGALTLQAQHLDIAGRAHIDQRFTDPDLASISASDSSIKPIELDRLLRRAL